MGTTRDPQGPQDEVLARAPAQGLARLGFSPIDAEQFDSRTTLQQQAVDALLFDLEDPAQRDFGDYELLELIGKGGMGVVYRARQKSLDREVAVKLIVDGLWADNESVSRFEREAKAAARLQHPNIVEIYDTGEHEGLHYISMRLVRGRTLAAKLREVTRLDARVAAELVRKLALTIEYAHRMGVLHLDLKPGNVLLADGDEPLLVDFGLTRSIDDHREAGEQEVSGTPSYMAPEQALGQSDALGVHADVYGLGALLYDALTGRPPFTGASWRETVASVIGTVVSPPEYQGAKNKMVRVHADIAAVCLKCLAKKPNDRYASAGALADDLHKYLEGFPVSARPPGRAAMAVFRVLDVVNRGNRRYTAWAGRILSVILAVAAYFVWQAHVHEQKAFDLAIRLASTASGSDGLAIARRGIEEWTTGAGAASEEEALSKRRELASTLRSAGREMAASSLELSTIWSSYKPGGWEDRLVHSTVAAGSLGIETGNVLNLLGPIGLAFGHLEAGNEFAKTFGDGEKDFSRFDPDSLNEVDVATRQLFGTLEYLRGEETPYLAMMRAKYPRQEATLMQLAAIALSYGECAGSRWDGKELANLEPENGIFLVYVASICGLSDELRGRHVRGIGKATHWNDRLPELLEKEYMSLLVTAPMDGSWRTDPFQDTISDEGLLRGAAFHFSYIVFPALNIGVLVDYCAPRPSSGSNVPARGNKADCIAAATAMLNAKGGSPGMVLAAGLMAHRLAPGSDLEVLARTRRREVSWLLENFDDVAWTHIVSPRLLDGFIDDWERVGEIEALKRAQDLIGLSREPPNDWQPTDPSSLLFPDERPHEQRTDGDSAEAASTK